MTLDELARLVVDRFARLETRLDTIIPTQEDHEVRIRKVERLVPDDLPERVRLIPDDLTEQLESARRFRWVLLGAAAATGTAGGGVTAAILRAVM